MLSAPFSVTENRTWWYRAVTITGNSRGPRGREEAIWEALRGASGDLDGLVIVDDDGLGDKRFCNSFSTFSYSLPTSSRQSLFFPKKP